MAKQPWQKNDEEAGAPAPATEKKNTTPATGGAKSGKATTVLVANQHTGGITFPRTGANGVIAPPLRLAPGTVTEIDATEWAERKKMKVVRHYLDAGLLAEVKRKGNVPVLSESTTNLQPPENLQTDAELRQGDTAKAGVRKENAGTVTVS